MTLQLSPDCDEHELRRELSSLDPRMLMFLRKLRHIKVEFVKNGLVTWKTELKRADGLVYDEPAVQLFHGSKIMRYVVSTHTVRNLPEDARRPGVHESDIVLAFPISQADDPPLETEKAYAFLPIRDFSFKLSPALHFVVLPLPG
ncbi:hypothetical protein H2198_000694 [Neophaeococcomyces mojaviensis]|uniref:Uncharacterized protein n=1 Tax=Neophaeococcomyces mojaviensis TaxID=3383035 RepID=A0ACC3AJ57_9EURO|nr:hypothetical protein H2198_000694 [Knufia sp. JES_112]